MKRAFEINLPMADVCQALLQSDGEMSGYHHKFEVEKRSSDEIQLLMRYSRRLKPEKMFRSQTRIKIKSSTVDKTAVYVDSYPLIWWMLWGVFFSVLYILPIINAPQLPYMLTFITFIVVGIWTARHMNRSNGYFLYPVLHQIFNDEQLLWIGNQNYSPKHTHFMFNRIIPVEIDSHLPSDTIFQNLDAVPKNFGMKKSSKFRVVHQNERLVILHYTKSKSRYWLRHRVDLQIRSKPDGAVLHGQMMIEPDTQFGATSAGLFGGMFLSLFWVYLGFHVLFLVLMCLVGVSTIGWWQDARKQQDSILEHIRYTVT